MPQRNTCNIILISFLCFLVTACGVGSMSPEGATHFLNKYGNADATPYDFSICYGYGCRKREPVSISRKEWREATAALRPETKDSASERAAIAQSIGALEKLVGERTGTAGDIGGSFAAHASDEEKLSGQLDCVDEAVNTSTYLRMMENEKLIAHHTLIGPTWRGYMVGGWPHTAAVLKENDTEDYYVIDSWFLDNGNPASVVELSEWKSGWSPED